MFILPPNNLIKAFMSHSIHGIRDMVETIKSPGKWFFLGCFDILTKYQRSKFGPWWLTLNTSLVIILLSSIWPNILGTDSTFFISYFSIGFIIWIWISISITETALSFIEFESILKEMKIPLSTLVSRVTLRNFFLFLHNIPIIIFVAYYFDLSVNISDVFFHTLPSVVLIFLSLNFCGIVFAILSSRYRDILSIITTVMQLLFFVTPIMWHPDMLPRSTVLIDYNIINFWIASIRQPLLGQALPDNTLLVIFIFCIFVFLLSIVLLGKYKNKVILWL